MKDLTPEEYDQLVALGIENEDLQTALKLQLAQADALRKGNRPEGQQVGRVYVAPNFMNLVGGLSREYASKGLQDKALVDAQKARENAAIQNRLIAGKLYGWGGPSSENSYNGAPGLSLSAVPYGQLRVPKDWGYGNG